MADALADAGTGPVVMDASAMLVLLYGEPGQEEIRRRLRGEDAFANTVNFSEVAAKLVEGGLGEGEIRQAIGALGIEVQAFDEGTAMQAGLLRAVTKDRGLSLGDRACVAYARSIGGVALTTDGAWRGLEGVEIVHR